MKTTWHKSLYELRFPFRPLRPFNDVASEIIFNCGELTVNLTYSPPEAVLRIGSFATHEDAEAFLPRVWGAIAWAALTCDTGFTANTTWSHLSFPEDPYEAAANVAKSFGLPAPTEALHALGDGGHPCVIPVGKNYRFISGGDCTVKVSEPHALFRTPFVQALSSSQVEQLYLDERLHTAVQLFSDSHREVSGRSKFLTYVIALEVLTQPVLKHPIALDLLNTFDELLTSKAIIYGAETEERHAIESLKREIIFRRETSLRSRIRRLVLDTMSDLSPEEQRRLAREAVWAYDLRSTLVHDGTVPSEDLGKATAIAHRTLLEVLRRRVGLPFLHATNP